LVMPGTIYSRGRVRRSNSLTFVKVSAYSRK
jgi:hypothetical protein